MTARTSVPGGKARVMGDPAMSGTDRDDPLPAFRALLEVARILAEMIRAEPFYAIPGYANDRCRLFPEAFGADVDAARARLGLPSAQLREITR